jgi:hypothetical protein
LSNYGETSSTVDCRSLLFLNKFVLPPLEMAGKHRQRSIDFPFLMRLK